MVRIRIRAKYDSPKSKWLIRKDKGKWYVWMPFEKLPLLSFPTWAEALDFYLHYDELER